MAGYNRIIMVGNLTKDPELRTVGTGSVCRLNLASNRQYKNRQTGAVTQEVCFVDADVWGAQADSCKTHLTKGSPVLVEGRLKLDSWKDAEGNTRSKHAIVADRVIFLNARDGADVHTEDGLGSLSESMQHTPSSSQSSYGRTSNVQAASSFDQSSFNKSRQTKSTPKGKDGVVFNDKPPFAEEDLPF